MRITRPVMMLSISGTAVGFLDRFTLITVLRFDAVSEEEDEAGIVDDDECNDCVQEN